MTPISSTRGNPDIKFPPSDGKRAIPFTTPGIGYGGSALIDSWAEAPKDTEYILYSVAGEIQWGLKAPTGSGTFVLASVGGKMQWIATTNCDATPAP